MKLVEVVATADSAEDALEATAEVGERMGRTPIRAKDSPGFIANRLARPFTLESLRMLADGVADAETIDRICRLGGGFRMGPFELIDLIGLDVNLSVARSFYAQGGEPERWRPSPIQERLVAEGRLGRKSGARLLRLRRRRSQPRPLFLPLLSKEQRSEVEAYARPRRAGQGRPWRRILPRLVAQIANEAAFALEEQVGSPADMDTAMRLGFNWPLGPLEFADLIGAERRCDCSTNSGDTTATPTPRPLLRQPGARLALRDAAEGPPNASRRPSTRPGETARRLPPAPRRRAGLCRRQARTGRAVRSRDRQNRPRQDGLGAPVLRIPRARAPRHRAPEPLAPGPTQPHRRPLRAGAGLLPAARLRPLQHARGRGRRRASSSSTRWSRPRPPRRRWRSTASTAATARSPG